MTPPPSTRWKLVILSTLYFVQGLPFGFQATALPTYLRSQGMSLTRIGFLGLLSLPWMLKALWAPLVDRFSSPRIGRRRSWILPMQALLALACAAAAFVPVPARLDVLLALVFLMNLFAATMDIAVDALAVDLLDTSELGYGNSSQVVGYKAGMLTGGGLLVWASGSLGWRGLLLAMASLVALVFAITLTWREPSERHHDGPSRQGASDSMREVFATLLTAMKRRGALWLLLFIGTYKLGETMVDTMFKPFLVDAGFTLEQIGLMAGSVGMVASLLGSLWGGWLASRTRSLWIALAITSALRAVPMAGEVWLTLVSPTLNELAVVTIAEHFFGGALTTVVFAFMMSKVDPRIGGTHYTLLATIEAIGKSPSAYLSGLLADRIGFTNLFALGTAQSLLFLALLLPLRPTTRTERLAHLTSAGPAIRSMTSSPAPTRSTPQEEEACLSRPILSLYLRAHCSSPWLHVGATTRRAAISTLRRQAARAEKAAQAARAGQQEPGAAEAAQAARGWRSAA